jgi:pimeloyl-ACP methyl ester carboxylesterase
VEVNKKVKKLLFSKICQSFYKNLIMKKLVLKYLSALAVISGLHAQSPQIVDFDTITTEKAISAQTIQVNDIPQGAARAAAPWNPPPSGSNPVRGIYWVHGLGGDIGSWSRMVNRVQTPDPSDLTFLPRKVFNVVPKCLNCIDISYEQITNVYDAATGLYQGIENGHAAQIANGVTNPNASFIISHSQGGIVSRALDYYIDQWNAINPNSYQKRVNGIVTFGTPHQGAAIVNNTPLFTTLVTEGIQKLKAGPLAKTINQNAAWLNLFGLAATVNTFVDTVIDKLVKVTVPIYFKEVQDPLAQEYKKGSPFLANTLGPHTANSTYHKATFYGVEEEPIAQRQIYSFLKAPNTFAAFQANQDDQLILDWQTNVGNYMANVQYSENKRQDFQNQLDIYTPICALFVIGSVGLMTPTCALAINAKVQRDAWADARDKYQDGVDYMNNFNDRYKVIIGATETLFATNYYCECSGSSFGGIFSTYNSIGPFNSIGDCANNCTNTTQLPFGCFGPGKFPTCKMRIDFVVNQYDVDGAVLANSAMNFPGDLYEKQKMDKSNHQQMRNDKNTKTMLNRLFDGYPSANGGYRLDPWFITPLK